MTIPTPSWEVGRWQFLLTVTLFGFRARLIVARTTGSATGLGPVAGPCEVATPESQGLSTALLKLAAERAGKVRERCCLMVVN